jgi:hypothetical protein
MDCVVGNDLVGGIVRPRCRVDIAQRHTRLAGG